MCEDVFFVFLLNIRAKSAINQHITVEKGTSTTKPQLGNLVESGATITTVEASEHVCTTTPNYVTTVGASGVHDAEQLSHQTELTECQMPKLSVGYLGRA